MDLLIEAWCAVFSFFNPNDIIEASAACKKFYHVSRKNSFFLNKLSIGRHLYRNERTVCCYYHDTTLCFSYQLQAHLEKYIDNETFFKVKEFMLTNLYYQIFPFCV